MKLLNSFFRPQFCLSPDPATGAPSDSGDVASTDAGSSAAPGTGEPPPATMTVVNGEITEELTRARKKLADIEADKKKVETRAAELEDENRRLKQVGITPAPAAPAPADTRSPLERFMAGEEV